MSACWKPLASLMLQELALRRDQPAPAHTGPDFAEIRAALLQRIDQLARELAPGGHVSAQYYISRNPRRDDRHPGSFWIMVKGPALGVWKDEATMDKAGDVISFVQHCAGLNDMSAVRKWCLSWLGWEQGVDRSRLETKIKADRCFNDQEERLAAEQLREKQRKAKGWWLHADKNITGTAVETYLASRGITLAKLAHPPRALRLLPKADHTDTTTGEITQWPCMIAAMSNPKGETVAVHRTFLAADGSGKAPVSANKKIWPHGWQGSVIRLARGAGNLTPEDAAAKGRAMPLVITEGIEDGLSIALACPEYRVWAAGTLGNFSRVPVEHPCVEHVIIFADNDQGDGARKLFDKGVATLREKRRVTVARSPSGKDANDLLRGIK